MKSIPVHSWKVPSRHGNIKVPFVFFLYFYYIFKGQAAKVLCFLMNDQPHVEVCGSSAEAEVAVVKIFLFRCPCLCFSRSDWLLQYLLCSLLGGQSNF